MLKLKSNEDIQNAIYGLKSLNSNRLGKYHRNYRRYNYTPYATLTNIRNPSVVGFYEDNNEEETDTTPTPQVNVIKSCIDTLTSKIAQSKVRPFFNTQNGTFKDIQIVKQAQAFFDLYYDFQDVNRKVSECFRNACIFDTGVIYIDPETKEIINALPFQVYVRPAEKTYGKITRVYYEQVDYPTSLLPSDIKADENLDYVKYGVYYDTFNHVVAWTVDDKVVKQKTYKADVIPFCFLNYVAPIVGNSSQSVVDMLDSIQLEINSLMQKVKDASQLNPANTYFLPQDSSIKATQINNRVGNLITYKATPNMTGSPVTVATPPFIDAQYMATVEQLKQTAYEMVGISQLSAMSTKPTGLDSGVALSTMENIESDRFEMQLNQVVRMYVNIAKTCIEVFPADEDILPETSNRISVEWADIVAESKKMVVQFSAADSLSKDPSTKLQQLQALAMAGIIPKTRIAQFMELPDIQSGYSLSNNAINAVLKTITNCIEKNEMEVDDFLPFPMLKEEIINTLLSLLSASSEENDNLEDMKKLKKLYENVEIKEAEWQADNTTEQLANAQDTAQAEGEIPQTENVLTQEANMTQVDPNEAPVPSGDMAGADMDMETAQGQELQGSWNNAQ